MSTRLWRANRRLQGWCLRTRIFRLRQKGEYPILRAFLLRRRGSFAALPIQGALLRRARWRRGATFVNYSIKVSSNFGPDAYSQVLRSLVQGRWPLILPPPVFRPPAAFVAPPGLGHFF